MKFKKEISITTENYNEEQFILTRFPEAVWIAVGGKTGDGTIFYVPEKRINDVLEALSEWKEKNRD